MREKENEKLAEAVRGAFSDIKPDAEAKKRMYQNIRSKAAAQGENKLASDTGTEPDVVPMQKKNGRNLRRYLSLAACLLLVITAGFSLPKWLASDNGNWLGSNPGGGTELSDPPTLTASPFVDVDKPEDFASLGFVIDAPKGAKDISYCIAYGNTAQVAFSLENQRYTYLAAEEEGDISGIYGEVQESQTLTVQNAEGTEITVMLEKIQIAAGTETDGSKDAAVSTDTWRASWKIADVTYCLLNEDGAEKEVVVALMQTLAAQG